MKELTEKNILHSIVVPFSYNVETSRNYNINMWIIDQHTYMNDCAFIQAHVQVHITSDIIKAVLEGH